MRLIDADALIGELHNYRFYDGDDRTIVYAVIENQPTIEPQPEIIYCKDCTKHNLGIGDFAIVGKEKIWIWKPDACPLVQYRGYAEGHEFDYQYCCCGKKRGDDDVPESIT